MIRPRKRLLTAAAALAAVAAIGLWAAGCGGAPAAAASSANATVTIPGDYYSPVVQTIQAGQTVTFTNKDNETHTVTSVAGDAQTFNLVLTAGASGQVTFAKPGVYQYYCTMHAHVGDVTSKDGKTIKNVVVADPGTDVYPAPMAGYIVVLGSGTHSPAAANVSVPDDYFSPAVTVISAGGTVTWKNTDTDAHSVDSVPGASKSFNLTVLPGSTAQMTFTKPGAYLYYCNIHATYDAKAGVVQANKNAAFYPYAMQGLVVVMPH